MNKTNLYVGNVIAYGNMKCLNGLDEPLLWRIINSEDNRAVLLSEYCVDWDYYHNCFGGRDQNTKTTLQKKLEKDFMNVFNMWEDSFLMINQYKSRIRLLTLEELKEYLPEKEDRKCTRSIPGVYNHEVSLRNHLRNPENFLDEISMEDDIDCWHKKTERAVCWWLQSDLKENESSSSKAEIVTSKGNTQSCFQNQSAGIRPVIEIYCDLYDTFAEFFIAKRLKVELIKA